MKSSVFSHLLVVTSFLIITSSAVANDQTSILICQELHSIGKPKIVIATPSEGAELNVDISEDSQNEKVDAQILVLNGDLMTSSLKSVADDSESLFSANFGIIRKAPAKDMNIFWIEWENKDLSTKNKMMIEDTGAEKLATLAIKPKTGLMGFFNCGIGIVRQAENGMFNIGDAQKIISSQLKLRN